MTSAHEPTGDPQAAVDELKARCKRRIARGTIRYEYDAEYDAEGEYGYFADLLYRSEVPEPSQSMFATMRERGEITVHSDGTVTLASKPAP